MKIFTTFHFRSGFGIWIPMVIKKNFVPYRNKIAKKLRQIKIPHKLVVNFFTHLHDQIWFWKTDLKKKNTANVPQPSSWWRSRACVAWGWPSPGRTSCLSCWACPWPAPSSAPLLLLPLRCSVGSGVSCTGKEDQRGRRIRISWHNSDLPSFAGSVSSGNNLEPPSLAGSVPINWQNPDPIGFLDKDPHNFAGSVAPAWSNWIRIRFLEIKAFKDSNDTGTGSSILVFLLLKIKDSIFCNFKKRQFYSKQVRVPTIQ